MTLILDCVDAAVGSPVDRASTDNWFLFVSNPLTLVWLFGEDGLVLLVSPVGHLVVSNSVALGLGVVVLDELVLDGELSETELEFLNGVILLTEFSNVGDEGRFELRKSGSGANQSDNSK